MDKIPMTAEGYAALEKELKHRQQVERPRIIQQITDARTHGDLSENAEYHAAKETQSHNETRIAELEDKLARAEVIDVSKLSGDTITFGATVTLVDEDTEKKQVWQLVGEPEADAKKGKISITSPLGCAASPGLFLAALSQRTERLRFGPLVYLLPFYHPLRLIEEICMLDQMSGGRLELGIGRGVSPFETRAYGLDFAQTAEIYHEAFQLILNGLTCDELTFAGKHYQFRNVPMILRPLQRPHPPLWYGITIPENADWPAANDVNIVTIALRPMVRLILDRYRAERTRLGKTHHPFMGVARHVVVANTDEAALSIARRAY